MDEGTRDWLTKIEAQLNGLNNSTWKNIYRATAGTRFPKISKEKTVHFLL